MITSDCIGHNLPNYTLHLESWGLEVHILLHVLGYSQHVWYQAGDNAVYGPDATFYQSYFYIDRSFYPLGTSTLMNLASKLIWIGVICGGFVMANEVSISFVCFLVGFFLGGGGIIILLLLVHVCTSSNACWMNEGPWIFVFRFYHFLDGCIIYKLYCINWRMGVSHWSCIGKNDTILGTLRHSTFDLTPIYH